MSNLRIVLDTNVLLSGLAYPASIPGKIMAAWKQGAIDIVLSRYILDEAARSLPRMSRVGLSQEEIRNLVDSFLFLAETVEPAEVIEPGLRDTTDLPILGTFLAAQANYLITGDKDLLSLAGQYPILTPAAFWERHGV